MNTQQMLNMGALTDYGILDPCDIDDCKLRSNNYVMINDEVYELCNFHYAELLTLSAHKQAIEQEMLDAEASRINQATLATLISEPVQ